LREEDFFLIFHVKFKINPYHYFKKTSTFALEMNTIYQHSAPSIRLICDRPEVKFMARRQRCGMYCKDFKQDL